MQYKTKGSTRNIVINCGKGGVAKTTTAVELANYLAREGLRVLLVDGDPQGDASDALGLTPEPGLSGWLGTAFLAAPTGAGRYIKEASQSSHLHILPGSSHTERLENTLTSNNVPVDFLARLVADDNEIQGYDFVVWDTPAAGRLMEMVIHLADLLVAPVRPGQLDIRGLGKFMQKASSLNPDAPVLIIPTMFKHTDTICSANVEAIDEAWPANTIHSGDTGGQPLAYAHNGILVIPERVAVRRAQGYGISVLEHKPADDAALAYAALGSAVLAVLEADTLQGDLAKMGEMYDPALAPSVEEYA